MREYRARRDHFRFWIVLSMSLTGLHLIGSTAIAAELRCWPTASDGWSVDASHEPALPNSSGSRLEASICLDIRPAAPGEVALYVLRRDTSGDTELLRREGGFEELTIDSRWVVWQGRVEVLPGWTGDAPRFDVTGDGRVNVLVRARSSQACCERWLILEIGQGIRVLFDDLAGDDGGRLRGAVDRRAVDVGGDGWSEIVATDAFAWPEPCGAMVGSPPEVVTVFTFDRLRRGYVPTAPHDLALHERSLRVALERLLGASAASTPLQRAAWLLPDFVFGHRFEPVASWCEVLPLVTALLSAGRERDAWAAFDVWYRGDDRDEVKAWLQGSWWWAAPWRWERGLDAFAGEWMGELATFVTDPTGALDLIGGGTAIDVSVWGDGMVGERVGELRVLGRDITTIVRTCPLVRSLDRVDGFVLVDGCDRERRYLLRPAASGTALSMQVMADRSNPSLQSGARLVRVYETNASFDSDVDALALGERLMNASCRGLRFARNEVFARRGWVFPAGELADAFASERWYVPAGAADDRSEVNAEIAATLPDADRLVVQVMVALERARGCEQMKVGFQDLVVASETHLRMLVPTSADRLAIDGAGWEAYRAECIGEEGRGSDACLEAVLVEQWRRALAGILEARP
jgi:hypothetical protein